MVHTMFTENVTSCKCFDISDMLMGRRRWSVGPYCNYRLSLDVLYISKLKTEHFERKHIVSPTTKISNS